MESAGLRAPPRHAAHARVGMAATSHPLASLAAVDILRAGGNAMDAAVAASAMLGVVEPMSTGIGGDAFCLYAPQGAAPPIAFNGSGRAPEGLRVEKLLAEGADAIDPDSPHSVTVPGAVDAYCRLVADHGRLSLAEVLEPAARAAEEGFAVEPVIAAAWQGAADRLRAKPDAASACLREGVAPLAGDVWRFPALARTLRLIGEQGRDGFYRGAVAEDMVACLRRCGGTHAPEDFAAARGGYVEPISAVLRDCEVYECPPNGQGLIALLMLNILDQAGLENVAPMSADRLHLTLEAGRLAFRDRARFLADPEHAEVPVERILSREYAAALHSRIDPERAMEELPDADPPSPGDTIFAAVVDAERNAASFISSLYHGFGSCILEPRSGVMMHCRGAGFSVEPGHPNCAGPGLRPMHTIMPGMLCRDGRAIMPFGVMGADYQPWGHVQLLHNVLLHGQDLQQALDMPRFTHDNGFAQLEQWVPSEVGGELARRGHRVARADSPLGGGQAIRIDWERGSLEGGSEPRKDGIALGY